MLGLDTNVLVRLLIEDDAAQTRRARKLVDTAIAEEETVLVSLPALLETEWVLRSRYEMPPETILGLFRAALEARELAFEDEAAVEEALFNWQDSQGILRLPDRGSQSPTWLPRDGHLRRASRPPAGGIQSIVCGCECPRSLPCLISLVIRRREGKAEERLESLLLEGLQGEETELTRGDWTAIRREARARIAATKKRSR